MIGWLLSAFVLLASVDPLSDPYRLKPGEFPPVGSDHRVLGELIEADFIHRSGRFLELKSGQVVEFTLLPFGTVRSVGAEADLRDVVPGTRCEFGLYQDDEKNYRFAATITDDFTRHSDLGQELRIDQFNPATGQVDATIVSLADSKPVGDPVRFTIDGRTRVWKGSGRGSSADLKAGEIVLVHVVPSTGRAAEIWLDTEARIVATARQREVHDTFIRQRGIAARIERVEGKKLTVALFGHPADLLALLKRDGRDLDQWVQERREVGAAVATEELRTFNPPVDVKRGRVLENLPAPVDRIGSGGVLWVIEPSLLLEGFRKGRIIRLFAHHSWPIRDMPFGEGVYTENPGVKPWIEELIQFPYRTDFGNHDLAWYRLKPGQFPPTHSDHRIDGEIVAINANDGTGRFRDSRTSREVQFTIPPFGSIVHAGSEVNSADLPMGTHCRFHLHQNDRGKFTWATRIEDEATVMAGDDLSNHLEAIDREAGRIVVTTRHAPVRDELDALVQPPDIGRRELAIDAETRILKEDARIGIDQLAEGDELRVNVRSRDGSGRSLCSEIWVGRASWERARDQGRARWRADRKRTGLPAWVEKVEGNRSTIAFFAGDRQEFSKVLEQETSGDELFLVAADPRVQLVEGPARKYRIRSKHRVEPNDGFEGSSGVRWEIDPDGSTQPFPEGQIIRVFRQGWPLPDLAPVHRKD